KRPRVGDCSAACRTRRGGGYGRDDGLDSFHALVKATVQRSRPVVLAALAAVLAFIPLTFSAVWGSLACTLIGGNGGGNSADPDISSSALLDLVSRQAHNRRAADTGDSRSLEEHMKSGAKPS